MDRRLARYTKLLCETMARGGDTNALRRHKDFANLHRYAMERLNADVPRSGSISSEIDGIVASAKSISDRTRSETDF